MRIITSWIRAIVDDDVAKQLETAYTARMIKVAELSVITCVATHHWSRGGRWRMYQPSSDSAAWGPLAGCRCTATRPAPGSPGRVCHGRSGRCTCRHGCHNDKEVVTLRPLRLLTTPAHWLEHRPTAWPCSMHVCPAQGGRACLLLGVGSV
jgi:hypothetical protein